MKKEANTLEQKIKKRRRRKRGKEKRTRKTEICFQKEKSAKGSRKRILDSLYDLKHWKTNKAEK